MTLLPTSTTGPETTPDRSVLDRLLAHHTDLTLIVTPGGVIEYASPSAVRGVPLCTPGTLLGAHVHPDDQDALTRTLRALRPGESAPLPAVRVRSGPDRWRWLSGAATHHGHDPLIAGVLLTWQDLTPPGPLATEKLTLYGADLVSILDADAHLTFTTDATTKILGHAKGALLHQSVFPLIHPDDHALVAAALGTLAAGHPDPVRVTFRFRHACGHWVWIEAIAANHFSDPDIGGILVNSRDVSATVALQEQLRHRETAFRHLFERNPLPMWLYDRATLAVTEVNQAAVAKYGYAREEFLGMTIRHFRPPAEDAALDGILANLTGDQVDTTATRHVLKDGAIIDVIVHGRTLNVAGRDMRLVVAEDVTAQNAAEAQRQAQVRRYQALLDLTETLAAVHDPLELAREALERCVDLTDCAGGVYVSITGDRLDTQHCHRLDDTLTRFAFRRPGHVRTLTMLAPDLARGQAHFAPIDLGALHPEMRAHTRPYRSIAALPVLARGQLLGAFVLFNPYEDFRPEARRLLTTISEYASTAMERSLHVAQLDASREETLRALGVMLEYRDYETAGHTDRVVALAGLLGEQVQMTGADLDALRWGAYLHDTGKVAIPDAILLKPGKLDPAEWTAMQRHCEIGYELLSHVPNLPRGTLDVVLHHHERWDGSGYPHGLAGERIPLSARLFALVDVYDALTDERPYKRAWSHDEALAEIERTTGSHFDPALAGAFLAMMRDLGPRPRDAGA